VVTSDKVLALGLGASRLVAASKEWLCGGRGGAEVVAEGGVQGMIIRQRVELLDVGARDTARVSDRVADFSRS